MHWLRWRMVVSNSLLLLDWTIAGWKHPVYRLYCVELILYTIYCVMYRYPSLLVATVATVRKADNQPWGGWNSTDVELEHTVALCSILKIIQNHPKSSKIIQNHPKSSKIIQNHPKSSKIIQNHPKYMGWGIFNEYVSQGWYAAEHTAQPMV